MIELKQREYSLRQTFLHFLSSKYNGLSISKRLKHWPSIFIPRILERDRETAALKFHITIDGPFKPEHYRYSKIDCHAELFQHLSLDNEAGLRSFLGLFLSQGMMNFFGRVFLSPTG